MSNLTINTPFPHAFQIMAKPIGPQCNLNCDYCFYLEKEALFPDKTTFRMTDVVLERFVRQYIESQTGSEVIFTWQGGEPTLLGIEFFKRAIDLQEKHCRPGTLISNALQTNGTLLNEKWGSFLKENNFLVGLSLDGPPEFHDRFRRDRSGKPSSTQVLHGLDILKQFGVAFNLLCSVNSENAKQPLEIYHYLKQAGEGFIQFIPIVEPLRGGGVSKRSVSGPQFGRFLCEIFDDWLQTDVGKIFVQHFDLALEAWMDRSSSLCVFAPTCGRAMIIEHNGDLYACDHYVFPEYRLGNIMDIQMADLAVSPFQLKFGNEKRQTLSQMCLECEVRFACNGGCPKNRIGKTIHEEPLNLLCSGYKRFFTHIQKPMAAMAEALRTGRSPAHAAQAFKQKPQTVKVGRNAPCPCGSGRKYKYCCLNGHIKKRSVKCYYGQVS